MKPTYEELEKKITALRAALDTAERYIGDIDDAWQRVTEGPAAPRPGMSDIETFEDALSVATAPYHNPIREALDNTAAAAEAHDAAQRRAWMEEAAAICKRAAEEWFDSNASTTLRHAYKSACLYCADDIIAAIAAGEGS